MIELMVALGVTLIMVAFFLNFSTNALSQWNRAAGRMTTENEASRVLDSLDQDLSTAVFRTDGRVWLAATIQPDQDQTGDTHGVSFSNSGSTTGQTRNFTSWTPGPRGNMKPKGMSSPYVPNAPGSSLVMPGYIPPATATQSTLTRSDTTAASNVPDITTFRFGQAGVWLRLFAPVPDSNNGQTKSAPVPRAIGYQIVRMKTADSSLSYRYYLMRSTVRPFGDIVTSQARSTFATGYDFFQTFATTAQSTIPVHTGAVSTYNSPTVGGLAQEDAGNIRQPNVSQVLADNVIDFGLLVWGRTRDPNNGREMDVLLFPASKSPESQPNLGFAATTEDGFTRRGANGVLIPGLQPSASSGGSYTGWGTNGFQSASAMTYAFAYNINGTPGTPNRPCIPVYVDVFLRILDEEGAQLIDTLENAPTGGASPAALPLGLKNAGEQWWKLAEQHSHIYTRRIQLPGVSP